MAIRATPIDWLARVIPEVRVTWSSHSSPAYSEKCQNLISEARYWILAYREQRLIRTRRTFGNSECEDAINEILRLTRLFFVSIEVGVWTNFVSAPSQVFELPVSTRRLSISFNLRDAWWHNSIILEAYIEWVDSQHQPTDSNTKQSERSHVYSR